MRDARDRPPVAMKREDPREDDDRAHHGHLPRCPRRCFPLSWPCERSPALKPDRTRCLALLRDLIRLPTVNRGPDGPTDGHERPAAERIADYLRSVGVEPRLYEPEPGRTSVVARIRGTGEKPPLLLNAHLDVVEADAGSWTHGPFEAKVEDGYLWGARGGRHERTWPP